MSVHTILNNQPGTTTEPVKTQQPVFTAAPHRMMFLGGVLQLVFVLVFWCVELAGRYTSWWSPLETTIPTTSAHLFLMVYGLFPFFFFGFLMTTYPRWMSGGLVPKQSYVLSFSLLITGVALFYLGLFADKLFSIVGLIFYLSGFAVALKALLHVYFAASGENKTYEKALNIALSAGFMGVLVFLIWLISESHWLLVASRDIGLWLFLVPVVFLVSHRMIPFFSSCVLKDYVVVQGRWAVLLLGSCVTGHVLLEWLEQLRWLWLFDLPMMFMGFYFTIRWGFVRSFQVGLLAVLHLAFLWFGLAMALYTTQSLVLFFTDTVVLGRAPLHALGIGYITSMVIAMASRVSLGHSGRPLTADVLTWAVFTGVSIAALLRIVAEIPVLETLSDTSASLIAAIVWLVVIVLWVIRYGPMYVTPRADGKPG
ncbi:MAG: NnrS family protein [Gammaproteobacteria bacterium]|nr:NnrS family protein [Gammaproteobacteria bacterium]MCK5091558.1 NnrS family protein [Gammaproteobacteria bacterium]